MWIFENIAMRLGQIKRQVRQGAGSWLIRKATLIEVNQNQSVKVGPRIVFLDALRFIAAAAVVFQHIIEQDEPLGKAIASALSPGVFGVVLFFIISGFVIPMGAKRNLSLRKFAVRRVFRIYPLVLATFALLSITAYSSLLPSLIYITSASKGEWLANLLLVQDYVGATSLWGVTWTLNLEVAWYTIFALSLMLIGPRFDHWLAVIAPTIILSLALLSLAIEHRLPLGRLGMIYAAILGARIYRCQIGFVSLRHVLMDLIIFIIIMMISNIISFGYFSHPNITMNQALYPWIAAPILFAVVTFVPRVRQMRIINNKLVGWLGAISFSTYLLHPLAMAIASDYSPASVVIIVSLCLTIFLSILGYYLIEIPGQWLGRQITKSFDVKR